MTKLGNERGFTLIELLVAMTISMIVLGATLDALAGFTTSSRTVNVQNDAQDSARRSMDQLAYELRNAVTSVSSGTIPAPVERAMPYDLIFQTVEQQPSSADANARRLKRVRYCLDDSDPSRERLWKQTQRLTSSAIPAPASTTCPSVAWNEWGSPVSVADRLVNGPSRSVFVFSYRPATPIDIADIGGIQTNLFVNSEPAKSRGATELTSAVRLRNADRRPAAAFTVTQQNGHVLLNASPSADPEGQPLTYRWSLDGGVIPGATNSRLDYPGLPSGTSHAFTLRVTDPGGLSASLEQTVLIQ